jgi:hypothetical protein
LVVGHRPSVVGKIAAVSAIGRAITAMGSANHRRPATVFFSLLFLQLRRSRQRYMLRLSDPGHGKFLRTPPLHRN